MAVLALVAASCSGSGESITDTDRTEPPATVATTAPPGTTEPGATAPTTPAPTTTASPLEDLPPCPVDALDSAGGPVTITFWHAMNADLETALKTVTDQYNASQDKVKVELVNQVGYEQNIDKYRNSSQGSRPNLVQMPEYTLKLMSDSGTVVPVQACIEASGFDTGDLLTKAIDAYTTQSIFWTMPFNISNPVLYYNRNVLEAAGLDPAAPPVSLEELRSTCETIVSSGAAPVCLALDSGLDSGGGWFMEQWMAKAGEFYADNGNGRQAPATKVLYDGATGVELLTFLQDMINDGLAVNVGENSQGQDDLFKLVDPQPAAMSIHTSAALAGALNILKSGAFPQLTADDLGIGPMPGPTANPGALLGGASLWIVSDKGDEQTAASWDFVQYLVSPEVQSQWSAATGYVPVSEAAIALDPIKTTFDTDPRFRVAYDQLLEPGDDASANGPVLGPLREVRSVTAKAVQAVFSGADVQTELTNAAAQSNQLIADYNARTGG
jgi:sn-glycerol 3-phosphate transport system substrate-binding protein